MPWKNKHQHRKKPDKTKQNGSHQKHASKEPVTNSAVQQLQSTRGSLKQGARNGDIEPNVYNDKPYATHGNHGNGARVQRTDMHREQISDRNPGQSLSPRPHSHAMSRQDYVRIQQRVAASGTGKERYADQQRRSGSPGRGSEAYLRQLDYQRLQDQQRPVSPARMRESQLRHQFEYQRQQQLRSASPQRSGSPQRSASLQLDNRAHARLSDYHHSHVHVHSRSMSPSRLREEQLRQIEYQRQLRKQREKRTSSPSSRVHYSSIEPTMSTTQRQQVSGDRRSRNESEPRRSLNSRERKIVDGIKEGGTLTREQRRLLIQQQRAFKAAQEKNQQNQRVHNPRDDVRDAIRLSPEDIKQHHDPRYLNRNQRARSLHRLQVREPSQERPNTASIVDDKQIRLENRHLHARSASLDRNLAGYQAMMNDPRMQDALSHAQSNGHLDRPSQQKYYNQPVGSPDGGIPPEMLKEMQHRITRRSKSPGALEAERKRLRDDLRRNTNHRAGIQLRHSRSPQDPADERQIAWRNAMVELKHHNQDSQDISVSMVNQGMTVVTIPYQHTVVHVDVHQEDHISLPEKTSESTVPHLVTRSNDEYLSASPGSPSNPKHSLETPDVEAYNSLSHRSSRTVSPVSPDLDSTPIPLPRRSRARSKHRTSNSPSNLRRQIQEDTQDLSRHKSGSALQKEQDLTNSGIETLKMEKPTVESKYRNPNSPSNLGKQLREDTKDSSRHKSGLNFQQEQVLTNSDFYNLKMGEPTLESRVQNDNSSATLILHQHRKTTIQPGEQDRGTEKLESLTISLNSPSEDQKFKTTDDSHPIPMPRRPKSKRSPRRELSERDTLTKEEAEMMAKKVDLRKSPRKGSPQTPERSVLPSKTLFQNRRHSMGLDNKLQKHPDPTTIPEQNSQKPKIASIVSVRYEKRRSSLGTVNDSVDDATKTAPVSAKKQYQDQENVNKTAPDTNGTTMISSEYLSKDQENPKQKISVSKSDKFEDQNLSCMKDVSMKQNDTKDIPLMTSQTELNTGDELPDVKNCEKSELPFNEFTWTPEKVSGKEQTSEGKLAKPDEESTEQNEQNTANDADKVVSTQTDFTNDEHNDSTTSSEVKEMETQYSIEDLPQDILNSSNSQSSVHVTSNNSFTSKSSNEHEYTDSLSDSTGSHILSPLAEDDPSDIPVPPPRYRKRQSRTTRRKTSEDTNSSESQTQEAGEEDYTALSQEDLLREDEDKVPGLGEYPYVKKRSVSGDRAWMYTKEQAGSVKTINTGLRGFTSPTFQRKAKDKRRQQKMLPLPGGHSNRMPRQPRPQRMQTIMEALKSGLKDSIKLNREKLQGMQQHQNDVKAARTRQGFHYNLDKQVKVAERYLRKLQFHLAKVEELQEQYEKELKVREGAVNMVKAYSDVNSPHKKEPVSEAKLGVKDCTQALCAMEAELEANLGAFVIKIEGIAGFARVCRGDIFEVAFKLGFQKFKSKCKVEKDLSQSWDGEEILLYPMVADFLTIKVTEMRGIARSNVVIGNLEFDTSDFYQAEPQNLTIDVNENGTIKLNVVATWSPFHIDEEELKSPNKNSYHRRERAFTEPTIASGNHFNTENSRSQSLRERSAPKPIDLGTNLVLTLEEAMHNVTRLLEILNGQYGELKTLEHNVDQLNTMLKEAADKKKRESIVSLSVKSALESFDFLNEVDEQNNSDYEDSGSGSMEETNRRNTLDSTKSDSVISAGTDSTCSIDDYHPPSSPSSLKSGDQNQTTKTDSQQSPLPDRPIQRKRGSKFIEMSEKRESRLLELNEQRGSKLFETLDRQSKKDSTENGSECGSVMSCGNDTVDMILVQHLMYIEYLLSHLGAFGPLKLKETNALEKLHKQAVIIEQLMALCVTKMEVTSPDEILPDLKLNLPLLEFWEQCTAKDVLQVKADDFLLQLDVKFGAKLRTNHPDIADNVFQSLCHRLVDRPVDLLSPKTIITLFQYITFFAEEDRRHPEKFINDLTKEFELTASLEPGNPDLPKIVKKIPKGVMLPTGNLRALSLLLLEDSATVQTGVRMYFESISSDSSTRQKVVTVYLECLEERDQSLRQAGCAALAAMQATESLDQLVYLLRCDVDDVKTTAKVALMAFGEKGRLAYEQISFASYGDYPPYPLDTTSDTPVQTTEL